MNSTGMGPYVADFLWDGPERAPLTVALAHGSGAPMDTEFMNFIAKGLAELGYRVVRFEFPFMANRRTGGKRMPPDRQPVLLDTWRKVIAGIGVTQLVIGGKSMGGRMASLVADEMKPRGLLCLSYPFYGNGAKDKPRIAHLESLQTPALICQGSRDILGDYETVSSLSLSPAVSLHWAVDGDHDLKPRKASGRTHDDNLQAALNASTEFLSALR